MSASIIPQVGPAMICASSSTLMPARGPGCGLAVSVTSATLPPDELRFALGEKRRVADAKVFGVEAVEALLVFGCADRTRIGEAAREALVPARDERGAIGDPLGSCERLRRHLIVGDDTRHQTLFLRLGCV